MRARKRERERERKREKEFGKIERGKRYLVLMYVCVGSCPDDNSADRQIEGALKALQEGSTHYITSHKVLALYAFRALEESEQVGENEPFKV